jgi:hypothetical protein
MAEADPKIIQDEEEFLDDVAAFHEERGCVLNTEKEIQC